MNSTRFSTVDLSVSVRCATTVAASACCDDSVTCACAIPRCPAYDLDGSRGTVNIAMEYAKEAHDDLFAHRRGIWDCGEGISCLFDNDPRAHSAVEIDTLRMRLANAGCTEMACASYPPAGRDVETYTLALLVRGDALTILAVYEAVDLELEVAEAAC
jgi:hypothetical protein